MSAVHFSNHNHVVKELIKEMNDNRVNKSVVMAGGESHELEKLNDVTKKSIKKFPDRLIGFVRINSRPINAIKIMKKNIKKKF